MIFCHWMEKPVLASKNYFCTGKKPFFSTQWQKLANPVCVSSEINK